VTFVASRTGTTASDVARLVGGADTATDWRAVLDRDDVDLVLIGTRHDTHAEIAAAALRAGKAVFLEKPLGLTREQIDDVREAATASPRLAIGFNRPFAPLSRRLASELARAQGPIQLVYRVNAPLPHGHWLNDPDIGGGRILGEACHMIDYANWLCGAPVIVFAAAAPTAGDLRAPETVSLTISYADGSIATVHYSGAGANAMPKERVEVFRGGVSWVLDDFRALTTYDGGGEHTEESRRVDKGHAALLDGVIAACRGGGEFIPGIDSAYGATAVGLAALESIASGRAVRLVDAPVAE
jgi:predicted dehydrogenase